MNPTPLQNSPPNNILDRLTVLYVEDDEEIRIELRLFLEKRVGRLILAADGLEGLQRFEEMRPDLVITDIRMPNMDGLSMSEAIRRLAPEIPIIVTTAYNDESFFLRAIETGVDHYVLKPVDSRILLESMHKCARVVWQRLEVETANRYVRFLLDIQPSMLLVLSRGEVEYLNRTFLEFLGATSFEAFRRSGLDIGQFLNIPSHQEEATVRSCSGWIGNLLSLQHETAIAFLRRPGSEEADGIPFAVTCNPFPEKERYLFSFSDITRIEQEMRFLEKQAYTDALTGICNRARLSGLLHAEMQRSARHGAPLILILFDIDHFKKVNDTHGHDTGDMVLRALAELVSTNLRASDIFARWGGEEFMVVSPESSLESGMVLAEKLRSLVASQKFPVVKSVTCSFGVSLYQAGDTIRTLADRADQALYAAKRNGRNRVETQAP